MAFNFDRSYFPEAYSTYVVMKIKRIHDGDAPKLSTSYSGHFETRENVFSYSHIIVRNYQTKM